MSEVYTYRIEVFTSGLLIAGSYDMPIYRRISDALNGDLRRYLALRDATVAPLAQPQQGQRVPELLVDRTEALLVTVIEEPPAPPEYYRRDELDRSQVSRATQPMLFFTAAFVLRGDFFKRPEVSLAESLERSADDFLPLSNVQIYPLGGGAALNRSFACLSRQRISALCPVPGSAPIIAPMAVPPPPPPPLPDEAAPE